MTHALQVLRNNITHNVKKIPLNFSNTLFSGGMSACENAPETSKVSASHLSCVSIISVVRNESKVGTCGLIDSSLIR